MTRTKGFPTRAWIALGLLLLLTLSSVNTASAKDKHSAKDKRSSSEQARDKNSRDQSARDSRSDKRASTKNRRDDEDDSRGRSSQSRRERALADRRAAEQRRREQEEARRRAEIARQAALARQRAYEQGLRDEAQSNISRDDTTGEDMEIRRIAISALGNHAGTVVVMDPKTGRIYTVVNQDWALRKGFKPCSTIKLVTGLAGLSEHVIDSNETVKIGDSRFTLDLTDSLAYSNNGYFQSVGGRVGFDRIISYARELGLGERTGINYPNEYSGRVPVFKSGYAVNHMCSHGDDFEVTPIQLATLVSAIANGGSLLIPHAPRTPQEDVRFRTEVRRHLRISQDALRQMIPGMIGSVNYGSGKNAYDPLQTIAGKTGTCIGQGSWLGLFTSYAPVSDPRLAVVVVTRGADARKHFPAAVAGRIYRALNGRFNRPGNMPMANVPVPRPKINSQAAAALSDEDDELDGDNVSDAAATRGSASRKNVKTTVMTRPTEETIVPARSVNSQKNGQPDGQRPRRVLTNRP